MKVQKNKLQAVLVIVYLGFAVWWLSFQSVVTAQGKSVQWYGGTYGVFALVGALIGFSAARKWGGFKTVLGKSLMFFSLGLLAQEAGQIIYTYFNYVSKIQIPYPSLGDVAYFGSVLLYIYAAVLLARASGVKFSLKSASYKFVAIAVFVVLLATSYWVFLHNHQYDTSKPLTVFLDFGYPMGQAVYVSLAITAYLLSRKLLGGIMRAGIIILILALFVQYLSDFTFLFQSSRGTWLAGRYNDLMYLTSYFIMTIALLKFNTIYSNLRNKTRAPNAVSGVQNKEAG